MCWFDDGAVEGDKYAGKPNEFKVTMMKAPCEEPGIFCAAALCAPCMACHTRKKVLDGDLSKYTCCQGYMDCAMGPCKFTAGETCHEKDCPEMCLCLESCCCLGLSVSSTRNYVMDQRQLHSDPCDRRIIRCNNFLQMLACVCDIIYAVSGECREGRDLIRCIADLVFCATQACMQAQVLHEVETPMQAPQDQVIVRDDPSAPLIHGHPQPHGQVPQAQYAAPPQGYAQHPPQAGYAAGYPPQQQGYGGPPPQGYPAGYQPKQ
eukprot:Rmarinus@m.11427